MGVKDKLKNVWTQYKETMKVQRSKLDTNPLTWKSNDPFNTQDRVSFLDKDFYKKPYGRSNKVKGVYPPGMKKKKK